MADHPRSIIIDTDPGVDDAIAILLAFASPELKVLGLTAVAGNVSLELTAANALRLCELAGRRDTAVFAGCARPLARAPVTAEVHGETGMNGAELPAPTMPLQPRHAVDWLTETVMAAPAGTITLLALGPLTNVASAIAREPRLATRLAGIVVMGGAGLGSGNMTPAAEFNIFVDPEAAAAVFASGARLVLVPLDVTHQALATPERVARIKAIGTPVSRAATGMMEFYGRAVDHVGGGPVHDACVVGYLLDPGLFEGRTINVAVETASELTRGMTVMDWRARSGRPPNCTVLTRIDAPRFFDLLIGRLARL